jgi:hypothetical protein
MPTVWLDDFHHVTTGEREVLGWYRYGQDSRFAFTSRASLRRWVDLTAARAAHCRGYVVRLVAAPPEAHVRSRHQAIFDAAFAVPLRTVSLTEALA